MATLQKLLWSREYSDFSDEVVLVESRFVLERKHGECLCMVHAGLTETVVLIAEERVGTEARDLRTVVVATDAPSNLEYLRLAHLFPRQSTRLSIRRHREHRGEHVLRLRLSSGKTWYLELAEGRHREDRWREWLSWICDLDEERREKARHPLTVRAKAAPRAAGSAESQDSSAALAAAARCRKRRDSRAYHWVGHFGGALSRDHDGQVTTDDHRAADIGLPGHLLEHSTHEDLSRSTAKRGQSHGSAPIIVDPTASLVWRPAGHQHSVPVPKGSFSSTNTYSSLEDIESVGSLVGETGFDWGHPVSDDVNRKLILCVGDLFQKFNTEAHGHGHVGRWRPMASLTAVDQLREVDMTSPHGDRRGLPPVPTEVVPHRRFSLPDVLEGEASFLDDMQPAADATHRASLVYLDLVNEDDTKTPHAIGGHVMLLSPEQTRLQGEIARCREMPVDVEFSFAVGGVSVDTHGKARVGMSSRSSKEQDIPPRHRGKKARASLKGNTNSETQHADGRLKSEHGQHLSTRILHRVRKLMPANRDRDARAQELVTVHDIDTDVLAKELTLLDSLLFVRVREAELADCQWLKEDRHTRAPHTTRLIEFFERVVGLVSTEIVRPPTARQRAAVVARFVLVAERSRQLRNFHSLKSVLSGLKVLPVYRLRKTWQAFQESFPAEYELWGELVLLAADDGRGDLYRMAARKSLSSPPCLPFVGTFLQSVVDLYSAVDRAGMQPSRRPRAQSSSSSADEGGSTVQVVHYGMDDGTPAVHATESRTQPEPARPAGFFGAVALATRALRHRHAGPRPEATAQARPGSRHPDDTETGRDAAREGVTPARKAHIRRLVVDYAKRLAAERGAAWRAGVDTVTFQDLLGAAFFAGVASPVDYGSLFTKVQPTGKQAVSKKEEEEEKELRKKSEYQLFETLFTYQMAAVQYRHKSNRAARIYLLHAEYNTDQQNFRLSMSREPSSD